VIGAPVNCTLWQVTYRHRDIAPPSRLVRLGLDEAKPPGHLDGQTLVMTADPTGADLCDVTRRVVLGAKATPEHEFMLTHVHRIGDAKGLAQLEQSDAGWRGPYAQLVPAAGGPVEANPGVVSGEAAHTGFTVSGERSESSEAPPAAGTESEK
jgi:hypothetical protein